MKISWFQRGIQLSLVVSLMACQSSTVPNQTAQGVSQPRISEVPAPGSVRQDVFGIKGIWPQCEGFAYEAEYECYASGNGYPQYELVPIPETSGGDDHCIRYSYCYFEESHTLEVSYESYENSPRVKIKVESTTSWSLTIARYAESHFPEPPGPAIVLESHSGTGNTEFDWDPRNYGPGSYSIYAKNAEKYLEDGFSLEYFPPGPTPTPTLPPATSNPSPPNNPPTSGGTDTCEEAPLLLPSQLTPVVQAAQQLAPPLLAEEHFLPPGLDTFEQRLKQIDEFNRKIAEEQAKAKPNQNKITNWTQQKEAKQAEVNQAVSSTTTLLENLASQRSNLRNQINTVAQDAELSQDQYQSSEDPDLPQTLEDYKITIIELQDSFELALANKNSYSLLDASNILVNESELYNYLVRNYLGGNFPFEAEDSDQNPEEESLEKLTTPKKVIRYLGKRLRKNVEQLQLKQNALETKLTEEVTELQNEVFNLQEVLQKSLFLVMVDAGLFNPETLQIYDPQFTIQEICYNPATGQNFCMPDAPVYNPNRVRELNAKYQQVIQFHGSANNFYREVLNRGLLEPATALLINISSGHGTDMSYWNSLPTYLKAEFVSAYRDFATTSVVPGSLDELAISVAAGGLLSKASQLAGPVLKKFIQKRLAAGQKFDDLGEFGQQLQRQADNMHPQKMSKNQSATKQMCAKSFACNKAAAEAIINSILENPKLIWGKSVDELANIFEQAGAKVTIRPGKRGSKLSTVIELRPEILKVTQIEYHPGGGTHEGKYYKISSSDEKIGTIRVVDNKFKPRNVNGKIIYVD